MSEISDVIESSDPRYKRITAAASTVLHVACTEALGADKNERAAMVVSSLGAALMMAFTSSLKPEHMRHALDEMVVTMRANVEANLKARGYTGP